VEDDGEQGDGQVCGAPPWRDMDLGLAANGDGSVANGCLVSTVFGRWPMDIGLVRTAIGLI